jgi:hypothetical protein
MTQEDKELLLKDLSARLPYGVKGSVEVEVSTGEYSIESGHLLFMEKEIDVELLGINKDTEEIEVRSLDNNIDLSEYDYTIDDFNLYLRPMSSMTEEEKKEYYETMDKYTHRLYPNSADFSEHTEYSWTTETFDFLNAHHLDYRGLIPKDLAIAVTKENNPYKE